MALDAPTRQIFPSKSTPFSSISTQMALKVTSSVQKLLSKEALCKQVSFQLSDNDISLEDALKGLCRQAFEPQADFAARTLSKFGIFGIAPNKYTTKAYWYEAMFSWAKVDTKNRLDSMQASLQTIRNTTQNDLWSPVWRRGLMFGLTALDGNSPGDASLNMGIQTLGKDIVQTIRGTMQSEVTINENRTGPLAAPARKKIETFGLIVGDITRLAKDTTGSVEQHRERHAEIVAKLADLFEQGYVVVTACSEVFNAYLQSSDERMEHLISFSGSEALVLFNSKNYGAFPIAATLSVAVLRLWLWFRSYRSTVLWKDLAEDVVSSVQVSYNFQVWLRVAYTTGAGTHEFTDAEFEAVKQLYAKFDMREPTRDDFTPQQLHARLVQNSESLQDSMQQISHRLSSS
ncbi:hypothetical protein F503_04033 [Ophiostoma piceae UAMH 11346]|uniref:Uncharacterized protein n=1 Tax=Ophiostoma piceae (strain UAMH 11346) TaxID=1262450 RepID=S3BNA0_OPHP1|nr:hypothetical protein F503_04033 [Ophiostoma piceae UAMH 11346]